MSEKIWWESNITLFCGDSTTRQKCQNYTKKFNLIFTILTTQPPRQWKIFFGNFSCLSVLIFFVNYLCLQNKLSMLFAISFSSSWKLGFGWVLGSLLIRNTFDFQLFNLSIIWKSKYLSRQNILSYTTWDYSEIDGA